MLNEIKKELLANPQYIVNILEHFEFYKAHIKGNEVRCGLAEGHNPTAICIKLINNENLYVSDFVRDTKGDIISYIIKTKNVQFGEVLSEIKAELGISDFYTYNNRRSVFCGFYDRIKNKTSILFVKTYDKSILNEYKNVYNTRFLHDNIGFDTQNRFKIGYDVESQRITIPIYNAYGELIGIKGRANWEVTEDEVKYLYVRACPMSSTLYGYCQNYQHMTSSDILVFEAEKSVLQCDSYGIHNAVALGSNSLSTTQCKLLMELNPKKVIFMLDNGLDVEKTKANITKLKPFTRMFDTEIYWWDWTLAKDLPLKVSPSDMGKAKLTEILRTQLRKVDDD